MSDLEKRIADLEARFDRLEPHVNRTIPLGPSPNKKRYPETGVLEKIIRDIKAKDAPPVDRSKQELVSGAPVPEDRSHTELKSNGQQKDYVVLTPEERAKGFVRPVRQKYQHVGASG